MVYYQTDTLEMRVEKMIVSEYNCYIQLPLKTSLMCHIEGLLQIWGYDKSTGVDSMAQWRIYDEILSLFNHVALNLETYYPPDYIEFKARIISETLMLINRDTWDIDWDWNQVVNVIILAKEEYTIYKESRPALLLEIANTLDYLDRDTLSIVLAYQN